MVFAGMVDTDVGIRPFGYVTPMLVTIGLWLTLAPAIGAGGGWHHYQLAPSRTPHPEQRHREPPRQSCLLASAMADDVAVRPATAKPRQRMTTAPT